LGLAWQAARASGESEVCDVLANCSETSRTTFEILHCELRSRQRETREIGETGLMELDFEFTHDAVGLWTLRANTPDGLRVMQQLAADWNGGAQLIGDVLVIDSTAVATKICEALEASGNRVRM
jgi:hypothetical protein